MRLSRKIKKVCKKFQKVRRREHPIVADWWGKEGTNLWGSRRFQGSWNLSGCSTGGGKGKINPKVEGGRLQETPRYKTRST